MISPQAQAAINLMMARRAEAKKAAPVSLYDQIQGIFAERRSGIERAKGPPPGLSLAYETADGVAGEWLRCLRSDPDYLPAGVILFLHGGGFASGSACSRRALAAKISLSAGIDSFSIDYRQCPEYRYPAHLDDCVSSFLWLLKRGYAPENIFLFGESAGANLALAMTHYLRDHHFPRPGGVCVFSPPVDMARGFDSWITRAGRDAMIGEGIDEKDMPRRLEEYRARGNPLWQMYRRDEEAPSPYVSPWLGDFRGFPRLLIQIGTEERLYDDAIALAEKAKVADVEVTLHQWEGLGHVFALFDCPETDEVCAEIGRFFKAVPAGRPGRGSP